MRHAGSYRDERKNLITPSRVASITLNRTFLSSSCHLIVCTECQLDSLSLTTPWVEWKKQKQKVVVFWTKVVFRLWPTGQLNVRDKNIQRWAKFKRMFAAGGAWLTWLTRGWWSTWCISPTLVGRWRHHSYDKICVKDTYCHRPHSTTWF